MIMFIAGGPEDPLTFAQFVNLYGPWAGLGLVILFQYVLPFLRDRLYPDVVNARKEAQRKQDLVTERQLVIQERHIDSLHKLTLTQSAIVEKMDQISDDQRVAEQERRQDNDRLIEALEFIKVDIAELWGQLGERRPSRNKPPRQRSINE